MSRKRILSYAPPPGLKPDTTQPFWVAVAYWGWVLGRPFGAKEVAAAFRVTEGQARNVLSAMLAKPESVLRCSRHYGWGADGRYRLVSVEAPPPQDAVVRRARVQRHRGSPRALADVVAAVIRQRARDRGEDG